MLKIWGRKNSANVKKVLWTAEILGLPYERIDAGGAFGVVDTPAYRVLNPNGLVPTLQDGDLTLWESNAIVRYLAARYGNGRLWSDDPVTRARVEQWMDWSHSYADPFRVVVFGLLRTPPEKRDMVAIAAGLERCIRLFHILDDALATRDFVSGADFGLADIVIGPAVYVWMEMPIERPAMPHLEAWYRRLHEAPAWAKVVEIGLS